MRIRLLLSCARPPLCESVDDSSIEFRRLLTDEGDIHRKIFREDIDQSTVPTFIQKWDVLKFCILKVG
jgi:hypothetical protein